MARIDMKLCQNAFQTIPDVSFFEAKKKMSAKISDQQFYFSLSWRHFGGATIFRTSKSVSSSNFALDKLFQRSVRPKKLGFGVFVVRTIFFGGRRLVFRIHFQ